MYSWLHWFDTEINILNKFTDAQGGLILFLYREGGGAQNPLGPTKSWKP